MDLLLTISVWLMVFGFHQYFLSTAIFILRKNKDKQKEELLKQEEVLFPSNTRENVMELMRRHKNLFTYPWFFYTPFFLLFVLTILILITLMIVKNGFWWLSIYYLILSINIIWLLKMKKEIINQTTLERLWFIFPTIKYPKKILNIIFQPGWTIIPFIISVIIVHLLKK